MTYYKAVTERVSDPERGCLTQLPPAGGKEKKKAPLPLSMHTPSLDVTIAYDKTPPVLDAPSLLLSTNMKRTTGTKKAERAMFFCARLNKSSRFSGVRVCLPWAFRTDSKKSPRRPRVSDQHFVYIHDTTPSTLFLFFQKGRRDTARQL